MFPTINFWIWNRRVILVDILIKHITGTNGIKIVISKTIRLICENKKVVELYAEILEKYCFKHKDLNEI